LSDPRLYWVGFNLVKGIGAVRFRALLDFFGDAQTAWQAPPQALLEARLSQKQVENLLKLRSSVSLEQVWQRLEAFKIEVLTWDNQAYPRRLREITQPPPVLYMRGSLLPQDEWGVAVVGTRRLTAYGRQVTEELGSALAQHGATLVSGLARGIDAVAHQAAINAGGRTLAVMGCGLDTIYPPEHRRLADQIIENGALLSDYGPGVPPEAQNFPPRNRIISGLSLAVVVVEAGLTSGALITARFAADQGRDVFATPGGIYAPQSKGCNRLIQDGAQLYMQPQDVLASLELEKAPAFRSARQELPVDALEARLVNLLSQEPLHVDEIRQLLSLPVEQVSASLTMLELKGFVRNLGGMQYVAARERVADYDV
jgi:DNA processing protein